MKSLIGSALLFAVVLTGCTISRTTTRQDEHFAAKLTGKGAQQSGKITARNGTTYHAQAIRLEGDSLTFLGVPSPGVPVQAIPEVVRLSSNDLMDVEFVDHGMGALEGLAFGAVGGFAVGFLIGAGSAHEPCEGFLDLTCGSPGEVGAALGTGIGVPSAFIGLIGGAIRGKHHRFVFTQEATRSPS